MDLQSFASFTQDASLRGSVGVGPSSLQELCVCFVGRPVHDRRGVVLGRVEDILLTQRGKTPRHMVIVPERKFWSLSNERLVYPLRLLGCHDTERLQMTHTSGAVRRMLDFKLDFVRSDDDHELISLVDYLGTQTTPGAEIPAL